MRPSAQVGPAVVGIDRKSVAQRALIGFGPLHDLPLERLVGEPVERLLPRQLFAHERLGLAHDLAHAGLDPLQVARR